MTTIPSFPRALRFLLAGLVVTVPGAACEGDASAAADAVSDPGEGVSLELARHREATIEDLRYRVSLVIPRERTEPITGTTEVAFRRNDPGSLPLVLDFLAPGERVREVRVDGAPVEARAVHDHVVIPGDALPDTGTVSVELEYRAGDESLNRSDEFLYALFVPDRAHFALPLFDQPDLKARFRLDLEVPAGWEAIANGARIPGDGAAGDPTGEGVTEAAGGQSGDAAAEGTGPAMGGGESGGHRRLSFDETRPISTYLFSFAAGRFEVEQAERGGRTLTFLHRETDTARVARNLDAIFDLHATALEWLEEYTGIAYPFDKFGFVAIPSFQYNGMEHPGAVFYRASSLFLDESTTQGRLLGRASLIAHETAHMWFGDLVTMEWFDDVWMKEVFANFMAARIVHPSFPDLDHELRFFLAHYPSAYGVDRTGGSHPIRQELGNLNEAGSLYGPIIYQKAPVTMRQLEVLVGEETFRDGLREYLSRFPYGNASWTDLIAVLDELTPQDLEAWSGSWVEAAGRPTIRAAATSAEDGTIESLVVRQEDPEGRGRLWPQAFSVVLGYGADSTVALPVQLLEEEARVDGARGLPVPDWVLPGGRGVGYGYFALDTASAEGLLRALPRIEDPLVRGVGWVVLWDRLLDGGVAPDRFLEALLAGVEAEDVELNLQRLLGYLGTTWWRVLDRDVRAEWAGRVEDVLWGGVTGDAPRTMRSSFFQTWRSVAVTDPSVARLREVWDGSRELPDLPLSEEDRTALAMELALREVDGAQEILDRQDGEIENPDRRERFRFVRPSLSSDPAVRQAFFESLADPENRAREPWVSAAVSNLHHPLRAEHGRALILPGLEMLEEIRRTGDIFFPTAWVDATLWGHSSPEAARIVRTFLEERPGYPERLRQKILQSADLLLRVADTRSGSEGGPT